MIHLIFLILFYHVEAAYSMCLYVYIWHNIVFIYYLIEVLTDNFQTFIYDIKVSNNFIK